MDYSVQEMETLETRLADIKAEATEDRSLEELTALKDEKTAIEAEISKRKADEAERREMAAAIATDVAPVEVITETKSEERTKMENIEIRDTKAYIDAYANYIKNNDDTECRALLTENVSGTVPVPSFVYDIVKTAWERDEITRRVRKAYLKGNLKVGFEISSDGATIHTEGQSGVAEESLVLGVINLIPQSIKKWISISDEVYDMRGEEFLRYIYDEVTYQIAKKAANALIDKIIACGTVSTTTQVAVPVISTTAVGLGTVVKAIGSLSDEASDVVAIMNKSTWADLKALVANGSYPADPFDGRAVAFSNHLPAAAVATTGDTMMIVGDLGQGALMNFPAGDGIDFKFDDTTLMTQDLIRVLGRQYVGIGVVAPNAFVKVNKA